MTNPTSNRVAEKGINCEECGIKYISPKGFNPNLSFAWCKECIEDYDREYKIAMKKAIGKHLETEFTNDYERAKFAWSLLK